MLEQIWGAAGSRLGEQSWVWGSRPSVQRLLEESMSAQRPARQGSSSKCVIPKPNSESAHTQPKHQTTTTHSEVLQSRGPNYHTKFNRNVEEARGEGLLRSEWLARRGPGELAAEADQVCSNQEPGPGTWRGTTASRENQAEGHVNKRWVDSQLLLIEMLLKTRLSFKCYHEHKC